VPAACGQPSCPDRTAATRAPRSATRTGPLGFFESRTASRPCRNSTQLDCAPLRVLLRHVLCARSFICSPSPLQVPRYDGSILSHWQQLRSVGQLPGHTSRSGATVQGVTVGAVSDRAGAAIPQRGIRSHDMRRTRRSTFGCLASRRERRCPVALAAGHRSLTGAQNGPRSPLRQPRGAVLLCCDSGRCAAGRRRRCGTACW
jgi:hypothetical protein